MKPSRPVIAALCSALIAGPALADACIQPEERTAFEIRALQSHLMVVALACRQNDGYNNFVRRYMSDLNSAGRGVDGHFRRSFGNRGRTQQDSYITQLANEQSQDGVRSGSFFCTDNAPLFQQVLGAQGPQDLAKFAIERNLIQAYSAPECTATPAATRPTARRRSR